MHWPAQSRIHMDPIVIIQHDDDDPPATIGRYLGMAGLAFEVRRVFLGDPLPAGPSEFSALIVLGGSMHTHQIEEHPFLEDELALLQACLRAEAPVLGICLGAQLLAAAAGGEVYMRLEPEIGWLPVDIVTPDPLMVGITSPFVCLEWHDYSFRLPPGSLRVAARDGGEQVFRSGCRAWGVQFHPEVDAAEVERWTWSDAPRLDGMRKGWAADVRADTQIYLPAYPRFCGRLVGNFLEASGLIVHMRLG